MKKGPIIEELLTKSLKEHTLEASTSPHNNNVSAKYLAAFTQLKKVLLEE
jgi:hypothetical protein